MKIKIYKNRPELERARVFHYSLRLNETRGDNKARRNII